MYLYCKLFLSGVYLSFYFNIATILLFNFHDNCGLSTLEMGTINRIEFSRDLYIILLLIETNSQLLFVWCYHKSIGNVSMKISLENCCLIPILRQHLQISVFHLTKLLTINTRYIYIKVPLYQTSTFDRLYTLIN